MLAVDLVHAVAHKTLAYAKLIDIFPIKRVRISSSGSYQHSSQQNPKSKRNKDTSKITICNRTSDSGLLIGSLQPSTLLFKFFPNKIVLPKSKNYVSCNLLTNLSISNKKIHKQPIELKEVIEININTTP